MDSKALHAEILQDLTDRKSRESRYASIYKMRRTGIRRASKPFPGAADTHYPLADSIITKQKPGLYAQIFSPNKLASFRTWNEGQGRDSVESAERYFDFKIRNESNFPVKTLILIDKMLEYSNCVLKPRWDFEEKKVVFEVIDPIHIIVPSGTKVLANADRVVEVHCLSVDQYKAMTNFVQDEALIKRITGRSDTTEKEDAKYSREGITHTKDKQIIIWEIWEKVRSKQTYTITWFSPTAPESVLRKIEHPYEHGRCPYIDFRIEMIEEEYYSGRGLVELVAPFQAALTKQWNEKLDTMTYYNRPTYTTDSPATEVHNVKLVPGQVVGGGIRRIEHGAPPMSFDQEMNSTRMIAENLVGQPDFISGQALNTSERRTKFELQNVIGSGNDVSSLRGITLGMALQEVYQQAWELLCEFDEKAQFMFEGQIGKLNKEAKHREYIITPNGSFEQANKQLQAVLAQTLFENFKGDPYIDQGELRLFVLEQIAPRQSKRLFRDAESQAGDQAEDQALELCALLKGFPMRVKESDDHRIHFTVAYQYLQKLGMEGNPLSPEESVRVQEHLLLHAQMFAKANPQEAQQLMAQYGQELQAMQANVTAWFEQQQQGQQAEGQQLQEQPV